MCLKAQQLYTCDLPNLGQSRRMAVCPLSLVPHARDWRSLSACTVHTFHISVQSIHIACQCNSYLPGCSILQVVCVPLVQELSRRLPRPPPGQSPGGSLCVFSNARTVCQLAESSALRSAWHCFQQATNMGHRRQLRRGSWRHRLQRYQGKQVPKQQTCTHTQLLTDVFLNTNITDGRVNAISKYACFDRYTIPCRPGRGTPQAANYEQQTTNKR